MNKSVVSVMKKPITLYYIGVSDNDFIEVQKPTYEEITMSLANGDGWEYNKGKNRFEKVHSQITLDI